MNEWTAYVELRGWRAWYADGRIVTSERPSDLSDDGLVCVVEYFDPPYKNIFCGGDYLCFKDGRWSSAMAPLEGARNFLGVLMPEAEFEALQARAMESTWR